MPKPNVDVNDGTTMPAIGFGIGTAFFGVDCADAALSALQAGYRYLDTAQMYQNAGSVGSALKRWDGGDRKDVYIAAKFGQHGLEEEEWEPRKVLMEQMQLMGIEYVDLYLIHTPLFAKPDLQTCWKTMEALKAEGLAMSIGVSNFRYEDLLEIKKVWTIPPAVNQIEYHPYVYHVPTMLPLRKSMDEQKIKIIAYGPLASLARSTDGPVDAVVKDIAETHGATEAQVLIAWARQHGGGGVTTNESRQKEQLAALDKVTLTEDEVDQIAEAGKGRFFRHHVVFEDVLS